MTTHSEHPLPDVFAALAEKGPWWCRCGAQVGHPFGACARCVAVYEAEHASSVAQDLPLFERRMARARESVPLAYRDVDLAATWLRQRVGPQALQQVAGVLPRCLALVGPYESGKTSLACAKLNQIHGGVGPSSPHNVVSAARRAFFVDAAALVFHETAWKRDKHDPEVLRAAHAHKLAQRASVLVIDNVEPGTLSDPIGRLMMERFNAKAKTIITTWMSKAEATKHYGGGWASRAYATTIDLGARS